ncbi:CCR4-NOT transcription complex subunit 1 isoform X1 [Tanacetum coccineum]
MMCIPSVPAGRNFCLGQIEELSATHASLCSADYVQDVLLFLNKSEGLSKHVDSFMQLLSLVQFDKDAEFILSPLLSDELQESNFLRGSLPDMPPVNSWNTDVLVESIKQLV